MGQPTYPLTPPRRRAARGPHRCRLCASASRAPQGQLAVIDALVRVGAVLDARDHSGWTALHFAASAGRTAACKALLLAGAAKDARNREIHSAADLAFAAGHVRTGGTISTFYPARVPVKRLLTELESDYHDGGRT